MWSTIRNPGDNKTERAMRWACLRLPTGVVEVKLMLLSVGHHGERWWLTYYQREKNSTSSLRITVLL